MKLIDHSQSMFDRSKSSRERLNACRKLTAYFALTKTSPDQIEYPVMEKNLQFSSPSILFTENLLQNCQSGSSNQNLARLEEIHITHF